LILFLIGKVISEIFAYHTQSSSVTHFWPRFNSSRHTWLANLNTGVIVVHCHGIRLGAWGSRVWIPESSRYLKAIFEPRLPKNSFYIFLAIWFSNYGYKGKLTLGNSMIYCIVDFVRRSEVTFSFLVHHNF